MAQTLSHLGSWGLPERGWTEALGGLFGGNKTAQGGSNLFNSVGSYPTAQTPQGPIQGPGLGWHGSNDIVRGGRVLGTQSQPIIDPSKLNPVTTNNNGGGNNNGNNGGNNNNGGGGDLWSMISPYYGGWNQDQAMADFQGAFGGDFNRLRRSRGWKSQEEINYDNAISNAYAPSMSALDQLQKAVESGKSADITDTEKRYSENLGLIGGEQKEGEAALATQNQNVGQTLASALAEAVRYYNGLNQQKSAKYGGGSSTGQAVGELAQQEFLRNYGKLQQTGQQGIQAIQQEGLKLNNYIKTKTTQLEQWKREALDKINENFNNTIASIGLKKGEVEANKTNAKMAALQYAMQQAQTVEQQDKQFRQQLGTWAVEQSQKFANRAFTPQEIANIYNGVISTSLKDFTGQQYMNPSAQAQAMSAARAGRGGTTEDELRQQGLIG